MGIGKDWNNSLQIDNTGNVSVPKKLTVADHIIQDGSLAFGTTNVAVGHTVAVKDYSHAEGFVQWAKGTMSTVAGNAEGDFALTDTSGGLTTLSSGSYFKQLYVIQGANVYRRTGGTEGASGWFYLSPTPTESLSNVSAYFVSGGALGSYSHSEGESTLAVGDSSHTEGKFTWASGKYSHAEGFRSEATGENSHAEGYWTEGKGSASHAEGRYTEASGSASHAEGYYSDSVGKYSHAEGGSTIAFGDSSHAEGNKTVASGDSSHAEGNDTVSYGEGSHAEGNNTVASGDYSHAEGNGKTATVSITGEASATTYTLSEPNTDIQKNQVIKYNDVYAKINSYDSSSKTITVDKTLSDFALDGESATIYLRAASGTYSHREGNQTTASGISSHAEGYWTTASGAWSHAEGVLATASGASSHAEGHTTTASGLSSHAEGHYTTAEGDYSHAEGYGTTANSRSQHVQGEYNVLDVENGNNRGTYVHIVGNGTASNARSNAHTLDWSGNAWFAGGITAIGNLNVSNGAVYTSGNVLYGAAWNDYAEYRAQKEKIEPGYCVASTNNGEVYKTTEKFQACDGIVSDTFGFAIGETDNCKTPLAVAGRVLAYYEGNRYDYNAGDTVCAGPNGKVCKMTREEIKEYPDRIIGIVSEIPEYKEWGTGKVKVDNRIWIKVK